MKTVYYFSGSGHTERIARFFAEKLGCDILPINSTISKAIPKSDIAVVLFPVYCQNIPSPVLPFLKKLRADKVVLIASYGKISFGNVLFEASKIVSGDVIAGAYVPIGHTFLNGSFDFDSESLIPIIKRIENPQKAIIPKYRKNPFASLFPAFRSRIGVKIKKNKKCNSCNLCSEGCPMGAIKNGKPNRKCIRCMKCVLICPVKALSFKNTWILKKYLTSFCNDKLEIYL